MADDSTSEQAGGEEFGNFASFMLVAGMVTAIFVAAFLTAFPGRIGRYFGGITIAIALITFVVGLTLDLLGFFGNESSLTREEEPIPFAKSEEYQRIRDRPNEPLPSRINFSEEMTELKSYFDGDVPKPAQSFFIEYEQLKSSTDRRKTQASSVRSALNPLITVVDDDDLRDDLERMGEDLLAYIESGPADNVEVTSVTLSHDGDEQTVTETQGEKAQLSATLHNHGEPVDIEVVARFSGSNGSKLQDTSLPVGQLATEGRTQIDTDVLVPSAATDVELSVVGAAGAAG